MKKHHPWRCLIFVCPKDSQGFWNTFTSQNGEEKFNMGVSKNKGTSKWLVYNGKSMKTLLTWMIWGYPYLWKHPHHCNASPRIWNLESDRQDWSIDSDSPSKVEHLLVELHWKPPRIFKGAKGIRDDSKDLPRYRLPSWWLNQPIGKISSSNWIISPGIRGENATCLKPPPRIPRKSSRTKPSGMIHL